MGLSLWHSRNWARCDERDQPCLILKTCRRGSAAQTFPNICTANTVSASQRRLWRSGPFLVKGPASKGSGGGLCTRCPTWTAGPRGVFRPASTPRQSWRRRNDVSAANFEDHRNGNRPGCEPDGPRRAAIPACTTIGLTMQKISLPAAAVGKTHNSFPSHKAHPRPIVTEVRPCAIDSWEPLGCAMRRVIANLERDRAASRSTLAVDAPSNGGAA
jgi:hypothetical protein